MIVGMGLVLYYGLHHPNVGDWASFKDAVTAQHPDHFKMFHPAENSSSYTTFSVVFGLGIVLGPAYWIGNQVIVQRVLGAKSIGHARSGVLFGALIKLMFPMLLVLPGILALRILPVELAEGETKHVFPMLVKDLLPMGVRGLVFAAMVAGMMGNLDSYLNSASTLWTRDILRKYFIRRTQLDEAASSKLDLRIGRVLVLVFLVVGAYLSIYMKTIFETMQWMLSLFQGPFLALLLFGMFWRRASSWGGLAGIVVGLITAGVLDRYTEAVFGYESALLHVAWWSFVASCAALVAVSWVTRPHPPERLEGLVYGSRLGGKAE
jgi:SSS family solute:Na+ symporter